MKFKVESRYVPQTIPASDMNPGDIGVVVEPEGIHTQSADVGNHFICTWHRGSGTTMATWKKGWTLLEDPSRAWVENDNPPRAMVQLINQGDKITLERIK